LGAEALYTNTSGGSNTAVGYQAMYSNTSGVANNAFGFQALLANTTGTNNNAIGYGALSANTTGSLNTADGFEALLHNTTGTRNTGLGRWSLYETTTGTNNIGIGEGGGYYVTGSNNIDIGAAGDAGDSGIIRIGTKGNQTAVYIPAALAEGNTSGFEPMYINRLGQIGSAGSSARFKRSIMSMNSQSDKLMKLRPVRFHYKNDKDSDPILYGLIAEEVNGVYPELVTHDADGKIHGVRYDELAPLLLHEFQEQHTQVAAQTRELTEMKAQLAEMKELNKSMQLALQQIQDNAVRMAKQ
jgi:hypothetical protein